MCFCSYAFTIIFYALKRATRNDLNSGTWKCGPIGAKSKRIELFVAMASAVSCMTLSFYGDELSTRSILIEALNKSLMA